MPIIRSQKKKHSQRTQPPRKATTCYFLQIDKTNKIQRFTRRALKVLVEVFSDGGRSQTRCFLPLPVFLPNRNRSPPASHSTGARLTLIFSIHCLFSLSTKANKHIFQNVKIFLQDLTFRLTEQFQETASFFNFPLSFSNESPIKINAIM